MSGKRKGMPKGVLLFTPLPWRLSGAGLALALLLDAGLPPDAAPLPADQRAALAALWRSGLRSPPASSIGRLFDGVYSLLTGTQQVCYEGQGATRLQAMAREEIPGRSYPAAFYRDGAVVGSAFITGAR